MTNGPQRKKNDAESSILAECDRNDYPKAAQIAAGYVTENANEPKTDRGADLDLELLSDVLHKVIRCNRRDKQTETDIGTLTAHLKTRLDSRSTRALHRVATTHRRQTALDSLVPASA